jgi:hypothetical protein
MYRDWNADKVGFHGHSLRTLFQYSPSITAIVVMVCVRVLQSFYFHLVYQNFPSSASVRHNER